MTQFSPNDSEGLFNLRTAFLIPSLHLAPFALSYMANPPWLKSTLPPARHPTESHRSLCIRINSKILTNESRLYNTPLLFCLAPCDLTEVVHLCSPKPLYHLSNPCTQMTASPLRRAGAVGPDCSEVTAADRASWLRPLGIDRVGWGRHPPLSNGESPKGLILWIRLLLWKMS